MSERKNYCTWVRSIENLAMENELAVQICPYENPIRMTIKPFTGVGSQLSMLESTETRKISPSAIVTMTYTFDGVDINISDQFAIAEATLTKFTKAFKQTALAWQSLVVSELHRTGNLDVSELEHLDKAVRSAEGA